MPETGRAFCSSCYTSSHGSTIPTHSQTKTLITQQSLLIREMGEQSLGFLQPDRFLQPVLFRKQLSTHRRLLPLGCPGQPLAPTLEQFEGMNHDGNDRKNSDLVSGTARKRR